MFNRCREAVAPRTAVGGLARDAARLFRVARVVRRRDEVRRPCFQVPAPAARRAFQRQELELAVLAADVQLHALDAVAVLDGGQGHLCLCVGHFSSVPRGAVRQHCCGQKGSRAVTHASGAPGTCAAGGIPSVCKGTRKRPGTLAAARRSNSYSSLPRFGSITPRSRSARSASCFTNRGPCEASPSLA